MTQEEPGIALNPKTGVLVLNFGEPEEPTREEVVPFLERIFTANASLEGDPTPEEIRVRSRELAARRAPGLIAEYAEIGGSPLNRQARRQAEMLQAELRRRGLDAHCCSGMQFTTPTIADAVARARSEGVERLVALPIYPLCGRSTTVAALEGVREAVAREGWDVEVVEVAGWHRHPAYVGLHADNIRVFVAAESIDLHDAETRLVFSAHGTPIQYLKEGNRYDRYVDEICRLIADELAVDRYALGFQNHTNRKIEWTAPDIDEVVRDLDARRAVVVAVSFMHEQSETLSELDVELRKEAEAAGLEFHRVPIPHDDPRFAEVLADLVEARLSEDLRAGPVQLRRCLCRPAPETCCLNGVERS